MNEEESAHEKTEMRKEVSQTARVARSPSASLRPRFRLALHIHCHCDVLGVTHFKVHVHSVILQNRSREIGRSWIMMLVPISCSKIW